MVVFHLNLNIFLLKDSKEIQLLINLNLDINLLSRYIKKNLYYKQI